MTYCRDVAVKARLIVASSPGKGRGCFAERAIARGALIGEAPVVIVPAVELEHLDRTVLENYYFQWGKDGALMLDNLLLCNHDYRPNAFFECQYARGTIRFVALRDIAPGEEVTINYNGDPEDQSPLGDNYGISG